MPIHRLLILAVLFSFLVPSLGSAQVVPKIGAKTHLNTKASALVALALNARPPNGTTAYQELLRDGTMAAFSIPAGSVFVAMSAEVWVPNSFTAGRHFGSIQCGGCNDFVARFDFDTELNGNVYRFDLGAGVVFSTPPELVNQASASSLYSRVYGYLVKDK